MQTITLAKIDESNFLDCFHLQLAAGQEAFVSHPIRSLAQAYVYYQQCTPFGILLDGKMIGYVMVIYDYDEEAYNIWHLMIDAAFQHKGYGRRAMQAALQYIATKPFGSADTVLLTCSPDNTAAYHLYCSMGFAPTGNQDEEEIELMLHL